MDNIFSASVGFFKQKLAEVASQPQSTATVGFSANEVVYSWRDYQTSANPAEEPEQDEGNSVIVRGARVSDFTCRLPPGESYAVRFLTELAETKVWLHAQENEEAPRYRGRCIAQVTRLPVDAKLKTSVKPDALRTLAGSSKAAATSLSVRESHAVEQKVATAMARFSKKTADDEALKAKKAAAQSALSESFDLWCFDAGKLRDVRTLLGTLDSVLWKNSGWSTVSVGELMMSEVAVKKAWRKAIILCHPDRHQSAPPEQQYAADRIFGAVNDAFKVYSP